MTHGAPSSLGVNHEMARLLSFAELKARGIPHSRNHVRRLEATEPGFPRHVQISKHRIAWIEDEVDHYVESRMAQREAVHAPPVARPAAPRRRAQP
jgi:predicted DNA-binding transcriptional regulator AlpA